MVVSSATDLERELAAWREAAERKLTRQADRFRRYSAYYTGDEPIVSIMTTEERRVFREFLRISRANWANLIVTAVAERLQVVGVRFGDASDLAWQLWQANRLDADAELAQTAALIGGVCPVLVQTDDASPVGVSITPESPEEAVVLYEPGSRYRRAAGYKRFDDDDGGERTEILILPDLIATWYSDPSGTRRELEVVDNPAGVVGMIDVIAQPNPALRGHPISELAPAISPIDRINLVIHNRLVATDYSAFRQIWGTGIRMARELIPDGDEPNGATPVVYPPGTPIPPGAKTKPVAPFRVGADRLLIAEDPASRFGVIPESSLGGYLASVDQDITQLAAITQTPPWYLAPVSNLSADAIKAAEAGIVQKVRRRSAHIGEGWEEVLRVALGLVGSAATTDFSGEVVWADFETRSLAQLTDSLVKMATLGVPREVLWARYGASPQEVKDWSALADAEAEKAALLAARAAAALGAPQPNPIPPGS
jgi:hypothetical protein